MAKPNRHRPFTPDPTLVAVLPDDSGNRINGVDEPAPRRASVVFWAPVPDTIAFGPVQHWFYRHQPPDPRFADERARRAAVIEAPLPPLSPDRVSRMPQDWTDALQAFVQAGDCEQLGVTALQPQWLYEGQHTPFGQVIVIAVRHDAEALATAPEPPAGLDVMRQYTRAATAAKKIAAWLRLQGWDADPVTGPMAGKLLLIPPAIEAGFGELGKHGSVISPEFGAAFRLAAVLTDAPFAPTARREVGIDDFCRHCRVCEDACPPEAIGPDKRLVRGVERWYVDFDRCLPFFAQTAGCAICIAVCPWSRPGVSDNLVMKLARRARRQDGGTPAGGSVGPDGPDGSVDAPADRT